MLPNVNMHVAAAASVVCLAVIIQICLAQTMRKPPTKKKPTFTFSSVNILPTTGAISLKPPTKKKPTKALKNIPTSSSLIPEEIAEDGKCPPGKFPFPKCNLICVGCHPRRHCDTMKGCLKCSEEFLDKPKTGECKFVDCSLQTHGGGYPCRNGGLCGGGICRCSPGYTGTLCESFLETANLPKCSILRNICKNGECFVFTLDQWSKPERICRCHDGYAGRTCDATCMRGTTTCLRGHCASKYTESSSGAVTKSYACDECDTGWRGERCDTACPGNRWGKNCWQSCSPMCRDGSCDPVDGACGVDNCIKGLTGVFCETVLPDYFDDLTIVRVGFTAQGNVTPDGLQNVHRRARLFDDVLLYHYEASDDQNIPRGDFEEGSLTPVFSFKYKRKRQVDGIRGVEIKYYSSYHNADIGGVNVGPMLVDGLKKNAATFKSTEYDLTVRANSIAANIVNTPASNVETVSSTSSTAPLVFLILIVILVLVGVSLVFKSTMASEPKVTQQHRLYKVGINEPKIPRLLSRTSYPQSDTVDHSPRRRRNSPDVAGDKRSRSHSSTVHAESRPTTPKSSRRQSVSASKKGVPLETRRYGRDRRTDDQVVGKTMALYRE